MNFIGRKDQFKIMSKVLKDKKAHMLALIGRRRVGKTYLIREVYRNNMVFEMTGIQNAKTEDQLLNFSFQLRNAFPQLENQSMVTNWIAAFNQLSTEIENLKGTKKPVVFFDELPWIAQNSTKFTEFLAHWWNNWASKQNIVVVLCGSAASWMIEHVVNAKGGLHNRISRLIHLEPFTLKETKQFLESRKVKLSDYQLIQLYMSLGGVPYYLEQVERGKSAVQNIQSLCFNKNGAIVNEFENLYPAIFNNPQNHIEVIKALAKKAKGLTRQEILDLSKLSDGGYFSTILKELETSGFISTYVPLENAKKGTLYRLTDEYSLFYLKFIEGKKRFAKDAFLKISQSQSYKAWCGYAFESLCMKHAENILKALGISGIQSNQSSFLHKKNKKYPKGFQIDMLIDRSDNVLTLCEIKYYAEEFVIQNSYKKDIVTKREGLKAVTGTKKMVQVCFITTFGLIENTNKLDVVDNELTMDILFE